MQRFEGSRGSGGAVARWRGDGEKRRGGEWRPVRMW